jgi:hypothetical protein
MAQKMTALWLIILTIITCASVPVVMVILTTPHPTELILTVEQDGDHLSSLKYWSNLQTLIG